MFLALSLLLSLFCGYSCSQIALRKGLNIRLHSFLGVLLGPIGLVISLIMPSAKMKAIK